MKKYYDLVGQRLVACLDWKEGYGTIEQAKEYFKSKIRQVTKKEHDKLAKEYCSK